MPLNDIVENACLQRWWDNLRRHPQQRNTPQEADCELIALPGGMAAFTIDTVAEECAAGFYTEPETIGWMGAAVSLSDLAAVGAEPVGLLVAVTLSDPSAQEGIARGLEAACRSAGTWVLGGDTNFGAATSITCAAIGLAPQPLTRVGCRPGDGVFVTGKMGLGACCAARALLGFPFPESEFRPAARLAEGRQLRGIATSCMDTSDGFLATLDQLARLNGVGFEISLTAEELLDARALELCRERGLSTLLPMAQQHGEFELVFTAGEAPGFLCIGRVTVGPDIRVGGQVLNTGAIRNVLPESAGDVQRYLRKLGEMLR